MAVATALIAGAATAADGYGSRYKLHRDRPADVEVDLGAIDEMGPIPRLLVPGAGPAGGERIRLQPPPGAGGTATGGFGLLPDPAEPPLPVRKPPPPAVVTAEESFQTSGPEISAPTREARPDTVVDQEPPALPPVETPPRAAKGFEPPPPIGAPPRAEAESAVPPPPAAPKLTPRTAATAEPADQMAAKPRVSGPSVITQSGGAVRIAFGAGSADLPEDAVAELDALALSMTADSRLRLQLTAYAKGAEDNPSAARRLSLARALAVRGHLIDKGIRSTRIDVRALGDRAEGGPMDRVDLKILAP